MNTKNLAVAVAAVLSSSIMQPAYQAQELEEEGNGEVIEQIIVTSTRVRRSFAEQPTRVEVLGGEEINEKVNMKPGEIRMLLAESTGIQVQQTSATSFNSSIRIQGLDGRYTQLLKDSMPLYGGFSGGLSLLQIAPLDLQRVEVIKGASSTLYGGGAIAGLVNLITKRPGADPEALLLLNATSAGGQDVSAYLSGQSGDVGATLYSAYNRSDAYDPADNGLSAIPEFERWTFNPRVFVEGERSEFTAGINLSVEDRLGGDMDLINGRSPESAYFESSDTERATSQLEYIYSYPSGNELVLRNSINYFNRDLQIPGFQFSGNQLSSFSEAHIVGSTPKMDWVAGINLWTEDFDQDFASLEFEHDFNNRTLGAFVQGTVPLSERWIVEAGLRLDSTSDYGDFFLPRVSLLYKLDAVTNIRIGGGLGYEEPNLFTEDAERRQFQSIQPLQTASLRAEESTGFNIDINRSFEFDRSVSLDLNFLMFYTRVDQPLRLLEHSPGVFGFQQPVEYLDTRGSELNAVLRWQDFKLFLGLTHTDVEEHDSSGVRDYLLVPENRVNSVLVYELEDNLRIGLEAYYYGHQMLSDGTKSRDYWVTGLMIEKTFGENNSFFLNFENFTDARLTRYGDLYTGPITNPVFNDIYAPLDGFVINGGIKIRL